jgi:hypothetical protein
MKRQLYSLIAVFIISQGLAFASAPCCSITNINARTGLVSGKEAATGTTFNFLAPPAVAARLKAGDALTVNWAANSISVGGREVKITNVVEPKSSLGPGRYSVAFDSARDLILIKNVGTGKVVARRATASHRNWWALSSAHVRNGQWQAETQGGAEANYQGNCNQVAQSSGRPHCDARCVLTTTGSKPGTEDDEYSCTCICN